MMQCCKCPFIFTCWRGEQGEDTLQRKSVTACPDCGRWSVHIMAPFRASAKGNNFHSRTNMHYLFFCELRSTEENHQLWMRKYRNRSRDYNKSVFDEDNVKLMTRCRVGITQCKICAGTKTKDREKHIPYVIDLDKEPFEEPPHWKEKEK